MSDCVIKTSQLTRVYETYQKAEGLLSSIQGLWNRKMIQKVALRETNLEISSGQIVGLIGANGAGKTTLLKLLSGLIYPTQGTAEVLGFQPWERNPEYLRKMSLLLGQKSQLWWDIPAADSFDLLARIYDLDLAQAKKRVSELAEVLDCTHVLRVQLRRLSLGERMKMEIIGSLLHSPQVVFLDEPTIGLDVVAQSAIRGFISEYTKKNKSTMILTSHYMDDISRLADRLLLMSKGSIVYDGTVKSFMKKANQPQRLKLSFSQPLKEPIVCDSEITIEQGAQFYEKDLEPAHLGKVLSIVAQKTEILNIEIKEPDFEKVIHDFLEKESRPL